MMGIFVKTVEVWQNIWAKIDRGMITQECGNVILHEKGLSARSLMRHFIL